MRDGGADGHAREEVSVLGEEDGEEEGPALDGGGGAVGAEAVVAEEVDEGGGGDGAEPGQEAEVVEPGADAVGAVRGRPLQLEAEFEGVGPEFDPVVYEEGDGDEGPDDGEEG